MEYNRIHSIAPYHYKVIDYSTGIVVRWCGRCRPGPGRQRHVRPRGRCDEDMATCRMVGSRLTERSKSKRVRECSGAGEDETDNVNVRFHCLNGHLLGRCASDTDKTQA